MQILVGLFMIGFLKNLISANTNGFYSAKTFNIKGAAFIPLCEFLLYCVLHYKRFTEFQRQTRENIWECYRKP